MENHLLENHFMCEITFYHEKQLKKFRFFTKNLFEASERVVKFLNENKGYVILSWDVCEKEPPEYLSYGDVLKEAIKEHKITGEVNPENFIFENPFFDNFGIKDHKSRDFNNPDSFNDYYDE